MNFVILVVGGALAIVNPALSSRGGPSDKLLDVLLVVPLFCCLLCLLYYDRTIRILRVAHYLATEVHARASRLCATDIVWSWEDYKRTTTIVNRRLAPWMDRVRWLLFLLPSCGFPALFFTFGGSFHHNQAGICFLAIDAITVIATGFIVFKAEETRGVPTTRPLAAQAPVAAQ